MLFLPPTIQGRDPVRKRMVRPIVAVLDWREQRRMWEDIETVDAIASASAV